MTMSSIEIWSTMLVLHTVQPGTDVPGTGVRLWDEVRLRDDLGTHYEPYMNGAGGSQNMLFVRYGFIPSPPSEARSLWLELPEDAGEVEIQLGPVEG